MRTTPQQNEDDASNASGETKPHSKKKKNGPEISTGRQNVADSG